MELITACLAQGLHPKHTQKRQTPCSNLKIKTPKLTLEKSLADVQAQEKEAHKGRETGTSLLVSDW